MHLLISFGIVAGLLLTVFLVSVARAKLVALLPLFGWSIPVLFGLMSVFERETGAELGYVAIVPFLLPPVLGVVVAIFGLVLAWRGEARTKRSLLTASAAAAAPAVVVGISVLLDGPEGVMRPQRPTPTPVRFRIGLFP